MKATEMVRWLIAVAGLVAWVGPICLMACERERPGTRTMRWLKRLAPLAMVALVTLFIAYRVDGDLRQLRVLALGMIISSALMPLAAGVYLWRSRDADGAQAAASARRPEGGEGDL